MGIGFVRQRLLSPYAALPETIDGVAGDGASWCEDAESKTTKSLAQPVVKTRPKLVLLLLGVLAVSGCRNDCGDIDWSTLGAEPRPESTNPLGEVGTNAAERARLFGAIGREVIAPAYAGLQICAEQLEATIGDYCAAPEPDQGVVEAAWRDTMRAWQRVQHVAVGPIEEANRRFRLQFFPDSNEAVERGVDNALAGDDALDQEVIANRSVGVQGLPALEYLLFAIGGLDDTVAGPRRCELAGAIAANVRVMATDIHSEWQAGGTYIEDFVNARGDFIEADDVLVSIFESLAVQAEFIADRKLKPALNNFRDTQGLESHYAQHSAANIAANLTAFRRLFASDAADAYRLRDYLERVHRQEVGSIPADIAEQFDAAAAVLDTIEMSGNSLEDMVAGRARAEVDLNSLEQAFQRLADLGAEAAIAAGVEIGFNFQDGD